MALARAVRRGLQASAVQAFASADRNKGVLGLVLLYLVCFHDYYRAADRKDSPDLLAFRFLLS